MRLIDADALIFTHEIARSLDDGHNWNELCITADEIAEAPSIDIVFCENCRDCVEKGVGVDCPSGYGYLYCRRKKSIVNEDDYCSWGEREGE